MPESMSEPETLRARIIARDITHSLSDRFRLATQLARAVFSMHAFDMVHKSIRPENIILFRDQESALGSAFLLGFDRVRRLADGTLLQADPDWEKNLYRHPQRQGLRIRDRYIMQHDIYSLGVCLLEIGLWNSFVKYDNPNQRPARSQTYDLLVDNSRIGRPEQVKSRLLSLATNELSQQMGTKYARIVESCLTCLDLGNDDFGDESEFQYNNVTVAVRYIEKVCTHDCRNQLVS
jgi:serine/threonine protein kinase